MIFANYGGKKVCTCLNQTFINLLTLIALLCACNNTLVVNKLLHYTSSCVLIRGLYPTFNQS